MPTVTYLTANGDRHIVDVPVNCSLMEGARNNDVPGIEGDCGGVGACATCHVYLPPAWGERVPARTAEEEEMLECANDVTANSRLSCQVRVTTELDGILVMLPKSQR